MNNKIKIEIPKDKRIIKLFKTFKINIYNIKNKDQKFSIVVNKSDLTKISKITKYKVIQEYGLNNVIKQIKINLRKIFILLTFILITSFISLLIIKINIITENNNIKSIIIEELEEHSIKNYIFRKNDKELNKIKKEIKENNNDVIEWINIKRNGMTYQINIEEKKTANKKGKKGTCNIVATQEGTITRILTESGTVLVEQNQHVNKGDVLISGETYFNEELKNIECASGKVYAKTWYTVNISIPKEHKIKSKTKKNRLNIYIKSNNKTTKIFKSRVNNPTIKNLFILNIFNKKIIIIKEYESTTKEIKYNKEEINIKTNELIQEKMEKLLKNNGRVIEQKVLKKSEFNSTIDIEIFIIAEEIISTQKDIVKEEET